MLIFVIFFLIASFAMTTAISRSIYADLRSYHLLADSKQSLYVAESSVEDVAYRFITGLNVDLTEYFFLNQAIATTTTSYDSVDDVFYITGNAENDRVFRTSRMLLYTGPGASFNFGVQTGNGGFELTNGSAVYGNVFSNGRVEKVGGGTATIYGDVISGGPSGLIKDVHATGSAWAHVIQDSDIEGSIYAYTLDGGVVDGGAEYYEKIGGAIVNGTPEISGVIVGDEATSSMPVSDEEIDAMKQDVLDTGSVIASTDPECVGGEYLIETDTELGWLKIECNLQIKKQGSDTVLTLTGPLWVEGNVIFKSGPSVVASSSIGNRTVPIIADNESNRSTSSVIIVENGTSFTGTGQPKSYIMLISQNNDAENGETYDSDAIFLGQSSAGDLLVYASHGRITLANSIDLNEVTAYKISLGNSAQVFYESGLVNLLFTSGPGGGFTIGDWDEIP